MAAVSEVAMAMTLRVRGLGFSVSMLDAPRFRLLMRRAASFNAGPGFGVRFWSCSCFQSFSEPLNEECSLSLPSLNQSRGSTSFTPDVCVRIQSSVSPRTCLCLRTRFARTAAAALIDEFGSASWCASSPSKSSGAGRRNGVSMAN